MYEDEADLYTYGRERRKYPRLDKNTIVDAIEVTYPINDDQYSRGKTDNISQGGLMMKISDHFEVGSLLQMKIRLPGWQKNHPGFIRVLDKTGKTPLKAIAEVIRAEENGDQFEVATKFINLDPEDYIALQHYLGRKLSIKTTHQ
jgi:c-di-GMP-binding flagellar brake protein YcgR